MDTQIKDNGLNQKFFELFKQIENHLGGSDSDFFMDNFRKSALKDKRLRKFEKTMDILRKLRNMEAHEPNTSEYYEVTESSISTLQLILSYIESPLKAYEVCTKESGIFKASIKDNVNATILAMAAKNYSYVPILSGRQLVGVFSGDVLLTIFAANREADFDNATTFESLLPFLALDKHLNETFEFVRRDILLSDLEKDFVSSYSKPQSLAVAFITENGRSNETIIGMITQWDLIISEEK